jgi:hypothetical protein
MTDEQLIAALILSYKNRGVDMSQFLTDPLFTKLPLKSQVKAIQDHASTLHEGIPSLLTSEDYKRIGTLSAFNGLRNGIIGIPAGMALASAFNIDHPLKVALISGGISGATGALASLFKSTGEVLDRRDLKTSLKAVSEAPSPIGALEVLSTPHITSKKRNYRDRIFDRIGDDIVDQLNHFSTE